MVETSVEVVLNDQTYQALSPQLKMAIFMGGMALLTSALVCMTAFTRIVIVLSFVRRALATQDIPPTPVILGLSLILTGFVMAPTFGELEKTAVLPYLQHQIDAGEALQHSAQALRKFMLTQTRKSDVALFLTLAHVKNVSAPEEVPLHVLVPAFVISELKTAFIMGFCLYLPFLLVDLVISIILMSLGMMMMPPTVVSTPFKLLLFVLLDGWHLVVRALCSSFSV